MVNLTISSDGLCDGLEVHTAGVESRTTWGDCKPRYSTKLTLENESALGIALDLLIQLERAGIVKAFNVRFPEREAINDALRPRA